VRVKNKENIIFVNLRKYEKIAGHIKKQASAAVIWENAKPASAAVYFSAVLRGKRELPRKAVKNLSVLWNCTTKDIYSIFTVK